MNSIGQNELLHLFGSNFTPASTGYQLPWDQVSTPQPTSSPQVDGTLVPQSPYSYSSSSPSSDQSGDPVSLTPDDLLHLFNHGIPTPHEPPSSGDSNGLQSYAKGLVEQAFPNDPNAWVGFNNIVNSESGWNPRAANPTSTARGLMQFLDTTAPSYGLPPDSSQASPEEQVAAGIKYVESRYGTPSNAWKFHLNNGWY
ncbi:MAG: hypothetical protein NVS1B10_08250 [Candidatus Saccharimonadales bacterium]